VTMAETELQYPYRPRPLAAIALVLLFGPTTVLLGMLAMRPQAGGVAGGDANVLPLSPGAAAAIAWGMCGLSGLLLALGLAVAVRRVRIRQRVAVGEAGLIVPASPWSREERTIAYGDIRWLGEHEIYRQRMLTVDHAGGSLTISASMLPSREAFDAIVTRLRARAPATR
jgi:hypothetical protein